MGEATLTMKKATAKAKPAPAPEAEPVPERQYGARQSKAKVCAFCKHSYLNPCSDKTKDSCPNFKHLQSKGKKK